MSTVSERAVVNDDTSNTTLQNTSADTSTSAFTSSSIVSESSSSITSTMESTTTDAGDDQNSNLTILFVCIALAFILLFTIAITTVVLLMRKYKLKITKMSFYNTILANNLTNNSNPIESRHSNLGEIPEEDLRIDRKSILGAGEFAIVYTGYLKSSSQELRRFSGNQIARIAQKTHALPQKVAVKVERTNKRKILYHEIEIMNKLGYHVHLLCLIGYLTSTDLPTIVLEYCVNKDLLVYLRKNRDSLPRTTKILISFAWQICDGMVYLSSRGFIHRDLAARNIFLTDEMVAKIGDFGLCEKINGPARIDLPEKLPIKWIAIESLKEKVYSTKTDIAELDAKKVEIDSKKLVKLFGGRRLKECKPGNESDCLKGFKCCAWRRLYQCFPEHCPEMI
uniref:Protein kinase domain-containing protein n=1 Tax=Acrobeloides nanus TaxID=290746 RepID=A0A914BWA5_9BILA